MRTCLLVIDMQWGMFEGSVIPVVWAHERLLANVQALIEHARRHHWFVVFAQHEGQPDELLAPATQAWKLHPSITPQEDEPVVAKRRPNAFADTELDDLLAMKGVDRIVVCGLQSDVCVDSTCRAAFDLGYQVVLVSDGHSTYGSDVLTAEQIVAHHNATLGRYAFVQLRSTAELRDPAAVL